MNDAPTELSPAGVLRRRQILEILLRESRRRRHRRVIVRGGAVCIAVVAAVLFLPLFKHRTAPVPAQVQRSAPLPTPQNTAQAPSPVPPPPRRAHEIVITRVKTDPQITNQLAVHPEATSIERIGDDQLLEQLALAHQPAGLARVKGKAVLLYGISSHSARWLR